MFQKVAKDTTDNLRIKCSKISCFIAFIEFKQTTSVSQSRCQIYGVSDISNMDWLLLIMKSHDQRYRVDT